jgi:hypothetical protein
MNPVKKLKDYCDWRRAGREDTGYGLPGICPYCHGGGNYLTAGHWNPVTGLGLAKFECRTCRKVWVWSRHNNKEKNHG